MLKFVLSARPCSVVYCVIKLKSAQLRMHDVFMLSTNETSTGLCVLDSEINRKDSDRFVRNCHCASSHKQSLEVEFMKRDVLLMLVMLR